MLNQYNILKNNKYYQGPFKSPEKTQKRLEALEKANPDDDFKVQVIVDRGTVTPSK